MRERRPGVWEIRVVVGNVPVTGRSVQRSFTVHGDADHAWERRRELVARFGLDRRLLYCRAASWTLAQLLERFLEGEHGWKPATFTSNRSVAKFLTADPIGAVPLVSLDATAVEQRFGAWRAAGRRRRRSRHGGRCCTRRWRGRSARTCCG